MKKHIKQIVVGISGASGAIYGKLLVETLSKIKDKVQTHLIVTPSAVDILYYETGTKIEELLSIVDYSYDIDEIGACVASGSYPTSAMVIAPCSMKTLAAISNGFAYNLLIRTADVMLKEQKPLIIIPRETPLNYIHLKNMLQVSKAGALVMPAMPAFYHRPDDINSLITQFIGRVLQKLGIENNYVSPWRGEAKNGYKRTLPGV